MTNYNAVSVNQNDNRDTVKAKQIWNNGQYNRNLYGSDDSIKPTPNTGLISLKKEDVEGTSKKLFRLRHCFDYYKDLSGVGTLLNGSYKQYKNYIEGDDLYFIILKEMYWNFSNGTKQNASTSGISSWVLAEDYEALLLSEEKGIFMPRWYNNPNGSTYNDIKYVLYNFIALIVDGKDKNRTDYAVNLWTDIKHNIITFTRDNTASDISIGLKYPSISDYTNRVYLSSSYAYVTYENISPYIITRNNLLNNANYYIGSYHIHDYNYLGWGRSDECDVNILPTLMHEYCEPVICPYNYVYNNYNNIYIGYVDVKYKLAIKGNASVPQLCFKNIPVYFSAYKCEAYKKK